LCFVQAGALEREAGDEYIVLGSSENFQQKIICDHVIQVIYCF
jgi:hypothetical protein